MSLCEWRVILPDVVVIGCGRTLLLSGGDDGKTGGRLLCFLSISGQRLRLECADV